MNGRVSYAFSRLFLRRNAYPRVGVFLFDVYKVLGSILPFPLDIVG